MGGRSGAAERGERLAARSVAYAERAVEALNLHAGPGAEMTDEQATADMLTITEAIARAFVLGYECGRDDMVPARALGGAREDEARKARKGRKGG